MRLKQRERGLNSVTQMPGVVRLLVRVFARAFVDVAYRGVLGRRPDHEGLLAHTGYLRKVGNLADLLFQMISSNEFNALVAPGMPTANPTRPAAKVRAVLIGNCQVFPLGALMEAMSGYEVQASCVELLPFELAQLELPESDIYQLVGAADVVFCHPHKGIEILKRVHPAVTAKLRWMPKIGFSGFHPDMDYVVDGKGENVAGPMGHYQSALAFFGWSSGLSVDETVALFRQDIFQHLGYFEHMAVSIKLLKEEGHVTDLLLDDLILQWRARGCFMHSINHPKIATLADVARKLLEREGIRFREGIAEYVPDTLADHGVWPVYPEIAARFRIHGNDWFKLPGRDRSVILTIDLREMVEKSYMAFSAHPEQPLSCSRLATASFESLPQRLREPSSPPPAAVTSKVTLGGGSAERRHPYDGLPSYQFWRQAVATVRQDDLDPVARVGFSINENAKVSTAGSCFAQHISARLRQQGLNYYIAERDDRLSVGEAQRRNYGVFSARYGSIYSARQLLQLFQRSFGDLMPRDSVWAAPGGKAADPFRPQIEPDFFANAEAVEADRGHHLAAVREMFMNLEVFVFTLGLTESWRRRQDGVVFPLAPGVSAGYMDSGKYEFVNMNVAEVTADLQTFIDLLRSVNPRSKIIITVSPVPLVASYVDRHVLVSNSYSKSVLRTAADEVCMRTADCDYFPSYEIITGQHSRGRYFDEDVRSITPIGVDHVMNIFLKHYFPDYTGASEMAQTIRRLANAICEEDSLDQTAR